MNGSFPWLRRQGGGNATGANTHPCFPKKEGKLCTYLPLELDLRPQISVTSTHNLLNKSFSSILNNNNWRCLTECLQTQILLRSNLPFLTCHTEPHSFGWITMAIKWINKWTSPSNSLLGWRESTIIHYTIFHCRSKSHSLTQKRKSDTLSN